MIILKLYRYTLGGLDKFGVAADEQEAYNQRATIDPTFDYLPVMIEEVRVDGYTITVSKLTTEAPQGTLSAVANTIKAMNRDQLKAWLTKQGVNFAQQMGEQKLRELALQHV